MRTFWKNVVGANKPMPPNPGGPAHAGPIKAKPVMKSITIYPEKPPPFVNWSELQFKATAEFTDGSTQTVTNKVTWSAIPSAQIQIDDQGYATAQRVAGTSVITATDPSNPSVFATVDVTVTVKPVTMYQAYTKARAEYELCDKFYQEYGDAVKALAEARKKAIAPGATPDDEQDADSKSAHERLTFWDLKKEVPLLRAALKDLDDALINPPASGPLKQLSDEAHANRPIFKQGLVIFNRAEEFFKQKFFNFVPKK
jgi:hypothetical protein